MAAIQALVNRTLGSRSGNPNSTYYSLARTEYGSGGNPSCNSSLGNGAAPLCVFYDVTQGDMDVNCTGTQNCYLDSAAHGVLSLSDSSYQPAYGTNAGWDFAAGIGTVNANNLVNSWPKSVVLSVTSTRAREFRRGRAERPELYSNGIECSERRVKTSGTVTVT